MSDERSSGESLASHLPQYARVRRLFLGHGWDYMMRGGYKFAGKKPLLESDIPGYHVETSFTDKCRPLVSLSFTVLTSLNRGEILFLDQSEELPTFKDRVVANFQPGDATAFQQAIGSSILDAVLEFGNRYPNLLPAFSAGLDVAGAAGFKQVLTNCGNFLDRAKDGQLKADMKYIPEVNRENFRLAHSIRSYPLGGGKEKVTGFEDLCLGESLAIDMTHQIKIAAVELSSNSDLMAKQYGGPDLTKSGTRDVDNYFEVFEVQLGALMGTLNERAASLHRRREI